MLNATELNEAIKNLNYPYGRKDPEAYAEYQRQERELIAQFHAYLDEEHGYDLNGQQQKTAHQFAYNASNGSGYHDYEAQYIEATEFAREILATA
jgi:hypothetical protein